LVYCLESRFLSSYFCLFWWSKITGKLYRVGMYFPLHIPQKWGFSALFTMVLLSFPDIDSAITACFMLPWRSNNLPQGKKFKSNQEVMT